MNNAEYILAAPADRADIIDFANFVFSQAHCPHDFKVLLPKVYGDGIDDPSTHFLARRDGKIRAVVAMLPLSLRVLDRRLELGFVGTVSVHPYSRGEGHMKHLMADMLANARARNLDMLILGGLRHRYNYFGFEHAGTDLIYTLTATSLRHSLKDVDATGVSFSELTEDRPDEVDFAWALASKLPVACDRPRKDFLTIMHSWNSRCRLIRMDGQPVGYVAGVIGEIALTDEALLPKALKALFREDGLEQVTLRVAPHEAARIRELSPLCERSTAVDYNEMLNVLNWQRVLEAYLSLKASYAPLNDGCVTVCIDGEALTLRVTGGKVSVTAEDRPASVTLTHMEAQRLFFGMETALCPNPTFGNWLPLPFPYSSVDGF